jgi:hypothetical protein
MQSSARPEASRAQLLDAQLSQGMTRAFLLAIA